MKSKILALRHLTLADAEHLHRAGSIAEPVFSAWRAVWRWSAPRFTGEDGRAHDAFYQRFGPGQYYARINRVRLAFGWNIGQT